MSLDISCWLFNYNVFGPFDFEMSLSSFQILHGRLVEEDGTINQHAFYNYLSAWASNDALAYSASMANLHPLPKEWFHVASDNELRSKWGRQSYIVFDSDSLAQDCSALNIILNDYTPLNQLTFGLCYTWRLLGCHIWFYMLFSHLFQSPNPSRWSMLRFPSTWTTWETRRPLQHAFR